MRTIYLIRHGEPDTTIHDDVRRPLTPAGEQQTLDLVPLFQNVTLDAVYASPFTRARTTVAPLASAHDLAVQLDMRLQERQLPGWLKDFSAYAKQQWQDLDYTQPGGESIHAVQQRYLSFFNGLPEAGTFAIGSHGMAMSSIVEYVNAGQGAAYFDTIQGHYGVVLQLIMAAGQPPRITPWPTR